ncbi:MAG: methenyltetrahydromethanopterin cyclohydrolase [Fuerstiella sp.]
MYPFQKLNERAVALARESMAAAAELRISCSEADGVAVLDFGVTTPGGLAAGLMLSRLCMAGLGRVQLQAAADEIALPQVFVTTDHPLEACLLSQYAGWKIATDDFFAMGSGPMRSTAGLEELFREFPGSDESPSCAGVLEAGALPSPSAVDVIRQGIGHHRDLFLAVAPTASQAGTMQVVARSVETAMHKLHELKFPVDCVVSGTGAAPLPPVAKNDLEGIGRTNDSILYGSTVNLWVQCDDDLIEEFGPRTPSSSSDAHGQPFLTLFQQANHDFYALDKNLFSPAVVIFHNLTSGHSFRFGRKLPELLHASFGL